MDLLPACCVEGYNPAGTRTLPRYMDNMTAICAFLCPAPGLRGSPYSLTPPPPTPPSPDNPEVIMLF